MKDILKYLKYFKLIIFSLLSLLVSFDMTSFYKIQLYFFLIQLIQQIFYSQFCLYFFTYIKDTYFIYIFFPHSFIYLNLYVKYSSILSLKKKNWRWIKLMFLKKFSFHFSQYYINFIFICLLNKIFFFEFIFKLVSI